MAETLNVIVVDDEYHARKLLSEYVSKIPFLQLAGTALNVFEAIEILQNERIDILLLDIQMPEITGLEFARSLKNPPSIIFITAYSDFAVESYELDVIDYLLKPIAFPRFLQAINKVMEKRAASAANTIMSVTPAVQIAERPEEDNMVIKSGSKLYKINYKDLLYIEGQREYVTFHTIKQKITTLTSLKDLEDKLPAKLFKRIHKSYIISVRYIELIDKNILHIAGKKLPIGRNYKEDFMRLFEK